MSAFLAIEIVILGVGAVWLLALIPAGLATALKGQARLLGWGCLTLGVLWFAGALSLAPAESQWAQRHYTAAQRSRAEGPFRAQRSPRTFALWAAILVALIAVLGFFAARPAPILGVNGSAIGNSMPYRGDEIIGIWPPLGPCQKHSSHVWGCSIYDQEGSGGTIAYRVAVHRLGCWSATPTGPGGGRGNLSGCLTIFDYL